MFEIGIILSDVKIILLPSLARRRSFLNATTRRFYDTCLSSSDGLGDSRYDFHDDFEKLAVVLAGLYGTNVIIALCPSVVRYCFLRLLFTATITGRGN